MGLIAEHDCEVKHISIGWYTLNAVDCAVDIHTEAYAALLTAIDCGRIDLETKQMFS